MIPRPAIPRTASRSLSRQRLAGGWVPGRSISSSFRATAWQTAEDVPDTNGELSLFLKSLDVVITIGLKERSAILHKPAVKSGNDQTAPSGMSSESSILAPTYQLSSSRRTAAGVQVGRSCREFMPIRPRPGSEIPSAISFPCRFKKRRSVFCRSSQRSWTLSHPNPLFFTVPVVKDLFLLETVSSRHDAHREIAG